MAETAHSPSRVVALGPDTWELFVDLQEGQGGLFGSCWCTWFHRSADEDLGLGISADGNRAAKEHLVQEGRDHAALVVEDGRAVAWAQYGSPTELPNIHHRKQYDATTTSAPDWRVTCIQVAKRARGRGLAEEALRGALELITVAGGGVVEGYPHDMALKAGKRVSSSFLYNATRTVYERAGFTYDRPKGQFNCVMRRTVGPTGALADPA